MTQCIRLKVVELAQDLNLPPVKWICLFEDDPINAFAMGLNKMTLSSPSHAVLFKPLERDELEAVMAHDFAYVAKKDMSRMTYGHGIQNVFTWGLMFLSFKTYAGWVLHQ